jgi:hypothetical protein
VDLVVMSSHVIDAEEPHKSWATLSYQVATFCPCPVLLVKWATARRVFDGVVRTPARVILNSGGSCPKGEVLRCRLRLAIVHSTDLQRCGSF